MQLAPAEPDVIGQSVDPDRRAALDRGDQVLDGAVGGGCFGDAAPHGVLQERGGGRGRLHGLEAGDDLGGAAAPHRGRLRARVD